MAGAASSTLARDLEITLVVALENAAGAQDKAAHELSRRRLLGCGKSRHQLLVQPIFDDRIEYRMASRRELNEGCAGISRILDARREFPLGQPRDREAGALEIETCIAGKRGQRDRRLGRQV